MSDETIQFIAAAVVALAQLYMVEPWKFPIFARFWDALATIFGTLANQFAAWSMQARHNYFIALTETP